ncbi:hypothetical protein ABTM54_19665, partial [Acinetobacter baumannii]
MFKKLDGIFQKNLECHHLTLPKTNIKYWLVKQAFPAAPLLIEITPSPNKPGSRDATPEEIRYILILTLNQFY